MLFDRLTGALKKEAFEYFLKKGVARAIRHPFFFSLALIELDRASVGSDEIGETQADLKTLGNLLRKELRQSDILGWVEDCVYGWIMVEADERGAQVPGERIRKAVERSNFTGKGRRRTISVGIATFPTHSQELYDLLQKAGYRLIRAKAQGGNRVCILDE